MARIKTMPRYCQYGRTKVRMCPVNFDGLDPAVHLPWEIIWNILSRLSIESIIMCKSVTKKWYQLVENPEFAKVHVKNAVIQTFRFVIQSLSNSHLNTLHILDFTESKLGRIPFGVFRLPSTYDFRLPTLRVLCSCNGLLCIASKDKLDPVLICNPLIKECVILPSSGGMQGFLVSHNLGFGFDSVSKKYKIVRECKYRYDYSVSRFEITTLGERSWRPLESPKSIRGSRMGAAVLWNETLHWKTLVKNPKVERVGILAFDLSDETFYTINFPEHTSKKFRISCRDCEMVVLKDRLTIIDHKGRKMNLWTISGSKTEGFQFIYECTVDTYTQWCHGLKYETIDQEGSTFFLHVSQRGKGVYEDWFKQLSTSSRGYYLPIFSGLPSHFSGVSFKPSFVSPMAEVVQVVKPSNLRALLDLINYDWKYWGGYSCVQPTSAVIQTFMENKGK